MEIKKKSTVYSFYDDTKKGQNGLFYLINLNYLNIKKPTLNVKR